MRNTDLEINRACVEIARTVDELVGRAQEKLGVAWPDFFIERSPLQLFWHFPSAVWLTEISCRELTRSFQFDVARVSTAGDGISRLSRQLIDEREVRVPRPAACHHAFVDPLQACLHYQRYGEEPGPDYHKPPVTYGPSPLAAAANDWSRIATAFNFNPAGGSVAGLAELAAELRHEPPNPIGFALEESRPVPGSDLHEVTIQLFGPGCPPPSAPPRTCEEEPPRRISFREFL